MTQQQVTLIAIATFPIVAPLIRWAFLQPGRIAHDWLWKRLPDGKMRSVLLRRVR